MKFALAQINTTTGVADNLEKVRSYSRRAAAAGARFVVFPEATMSAFGRGLAEIAERRRQERFEDARDLMAGGVHPDWIPARLGCTRDALAIQARRYGAPDIYEWAKSAERTKPCPDCGRDIRKASTRCTDCALVARWVKGAA